MKKSSDHRVIASQDLDRKKKPYWKMSSSQSTILTSPKPSFDSCYIFWNVVSLSLCLQTHFPWSSPLSSRHKHTSMLCSFPAHADTTGMLLQSSSLDQQMPYNSREDLSRAGEGTTYSSSPEPKPWRVGLIQTTSSWSVLAQEAKCSLRTLMDRSCRRLWPCCNEEGRWPLLSTGHL